MATLPKGIHTSIAEYKELTSRFCKWLICRAEDLDIRSLDGLKPTPRQHSFPSRAKPGRGKGKRSGPRKPPPSTLPTQPTVSQLVKLAESIARITNQAVPGEVFTDFLDPLITLRQQVSDFFHSVPNPTSEQHTSNVRHLHFIRSLKAIRQFLEACPTSRADNTVISRPLMSLLGLFNEEEEPSAEAEADEWLPDYLKNKDKCKRTGHAEAPHQGTPSSQFQIHADDNNDQDAAQIIAWMYFRDLQRLRNHIRDLWLQYRAGKISLATVSFLTTQSVEIAKEMEEDLILSFKHFFSPHMEYPTLFGSLFRFSSEPSALETALKLQEMDYATIDFCMGQTYSALWQFGQALDRLKPGTLPTPKENFFRPYQPDADRSTMDSKTLYQQDISMFAYHFPEVLFNAVGSGSSVNESRTGSGAVDEPVLVRNFRFFIKKNTKRPIPFFLLYEWTMWKDILLVNGSALQQPLDELLALARRLHRSGLGWLNELNPTHYARNDMDSWCVLMREEVDKVKRMVIDDAVADWKTVNNIPRAAGEPDHLMWYANPWACGAAMYQLLSMLYHSSVQLVNGSGYVASLLHLYHALRLDDRVQRWPFMEKLLTLMQPRAFGKALPKRGQCLRSLERCFGERTGVLPIDIGGSLLGKLAGILEYRLDDDIMDTLFPDSKAGILSTFTSSSSSGLKFGGWKCDAFTLLDRLKHHIELELNSTCLTLDLFSTERLATSVFVRWRESSHDDLVSIFGRSYLYQMGMMDVKAWMELFETPAGKREKLFGQNATLERMESITQGAVKAVTSARKNFEKALSNGIPAYYLDVKED